MTVHFCDASDFDWSRGPVDVASMAVDGIVALTHKATEATNTRHVHLADALNRGRAAGIPVLGAYHVVRSTPSVQAQVAYFLAYLDSAVPWWRTWPGFVLQVDLEKWSYDPVSASTGLSFTTALRAAAPRNTFVVVYASKGQYGDSLTGIGVPLWNANYPSSRAAAYRTLYPGDTGPGWAAYSGQTPVFWQYASTAQIGSQPGCDVNAFRGTLQQLQTLLGAAPSLPGVKGDRMLFLTHISGQPAVCDGMSCRIVTDKDISDLRFLASEGWLQLANGGQFRDGYVPAFGVVPSGQPIALSADDLVALAAAVTGRPDNPLGPADQPAIEAALGDVLARVGLRLN